MWSVDTQLQPQPQSQPQLFTRQPQSSHPYATVCPSLCAWRMQCVQQWRVSTAIQHDIYQIAGILADAVFQQQQQ